MTDGVSKCGRKTALSFFFVVSLLGFLFCLLSLLSPSWQYANLENGRTEHHHGLWLDCKRDYSFDYGRTREYYETLYRRDMQGSPFAVFFLPPLQCVYKFDYYIDPEDLYDHNHDENRLQNDANQHLFLGWKIATLAAVGSAVCFAGVAILMGICSFCHRTFICASTVLTTIAAILSTVGLVVFYMWANYQDNLVIKEEEDTIYEQTLGWAFHFQVVGAILLWISSILGCCVTSVSLSKGRAKLVKVEVTEGDDAMLLSSSSSQPFKRSFSAVYRVDSHALRQFERDYLKHARAVQSSSSDLSNFKRTSSVPNFTKKQRKEDRKRSRQLQRSNQDLFSSTSNITESTRTGSNITINMPNRDSYHEPAPNVMVLPSSQPTPKLKSALKTPQTSRKTLNEDSTYEYLPCSSIGVSTFKSAAQSPKSHAYDPVYEEIGPQMYLEPNSVRARSQNSTLSLEERNKKALLPSLNPTGSSQSIPLLPPKTTVIDDKARPSSSDNLSQKDIHRTREQRTIEELTRLQRFHRNTQQQEALPKPILKPKPPVPPPATKPPMTIKDFGIDLSRKTPGYCMEILPSKSSPPRVPPKETTLEASPPREKIIPIARISDNDLHKSKELIAIENRLKELNGRIADIKEKGKSHKRDDSAESFPDPPDGLAINTFSFGTTEGRRSITNLTFRPPAAGVELFERPDSMDVPPAALPYPVHKQMTRVVPLDVDRSVGSSTMIENDTMSETGSYARDADVRLNLFLKDSSNDETTV